MIQTVRPLFDNPPPDIFGTDPEDQADVAWMLKQLGNADRKTLHDTVRMLTGSAADLLDDYFEHDAIKGYLASSSIIGTQIGPMSGGSGLVLLFHKMGEHDGHLGSWAFHKGGNGGFTQVLSRAAQAYGAEIELDARVASVITRDGRATGVALADGTELSAPIVVSALDARRTFLDLVDPRELPDDLVDNVRRTRYRGVSSKVNFALDGLPEFPGLPGSSAPVQRLPQHRPDAGVHGARLRRREVRLVLRPSLHRRRDAVDARPRHGAARQARAVVLRAVLAVRAAQDGQPVDWETERENFGDKTQAVLEEHFPGFGDLVLQREIVTPVDIERVTGLSEGNIFAGEFLAPQMYFFRPSPGWSQYATPIDGYYQCGSGTHPGGCVIGAPGKLASQRILRDRARGGDRSEAASVYPGGRVNLRLSAETSADNRQFRLTTPAAALDWWALRALAADRVGTARTSFNDPSREAEKEVRRAPACHRSTPGTDRRDPRAGGRDRLRGRVLRRPR